LSQSPVPDVGRDVALVRLRLAHYCVAMLHQDVDSASDPTMDPALVQRLLPLIASSSSAGAAATAPATGGSLPWVPHSTAADVQAAVAAARVAQSAWQELPLAARTRPFLRLHDLVLDYQEELLDLIQRENGKARTHAIEEVLDVAAVARHYARSARRYLRPRRRWGAIPVLSQPQESRLPKGVVGIISPWNYPLTLALTDAIAALIAGNAVVLKPDSQTVFTALRGVELLYAAGIPPELVQVVIGDGPTIGAAVIDQADYLCFTGSTTTGRVVAAQAGQRLIGASLELGGKNAMYVRADADLPRAVRGAIRGCFASTGQLCISTERLLVHEDIAEEFLGLFVAQVAALKLGATLDYVPDLGSLTSAAQLATVTEHVADALRCGAQVLTGGRPRPDLGPYFFEPTVLANVSPAARCYSEETFGPVVSVIRVGDDNEAVARANEGDYGLSASIWTRDVRTGRQLAARIKAGTVGINDPYSAAWASVAAPMGGMRASGLGRRHGAEGIQKYTESQNVTVQRWIGFTAPARISTRRWIALLTGALRLLKGLRIP
jgi:succinate-semialdehyde dehydrogenase / glutarate-semialdehyde dehydrogenase